MTKNIIVLSDGTGQVGGRGHDTNIYKIFRMLEDRTPNQIVFYDQGIGTDWHKITGNAFGVGFSKNILQCYKFIYDNYEAGDKIYLLGFSRGAATVRSLSNFIHYFGILPKARPGLIQEAWRLYKAGKQERPKSVEDKKNPQSLVGRMAASGFDLIDRAADRLDSALRDPLSEKAKNFVREHPNQWTAIEFLGVYDTVPALGLVPLAGLNALINNIPWWKHRFHDFKLHPSVRHAYHALSIDDDRLWFHPTIWKESNPRQTVEQVWFSGAHTDVGGGFMEAGLSDLGLEWLLQKAVDHGIRLYLRTRPDWNFVISPDATDRWHPPRAGFGKIYAFAQRDKVWDKQALNSYGPPKVHASVLERAAADSSYRPWILTQYAGYLDQLPGRFAEALKDKHAEAYDAAFERYAEYMMSSGETDGEVPEAPPDRDTWLKQNPLEDWLAQNHPGYIARLRIVKDDAEMRTWLEQYPPYQDWLAATYPAFAATEFGSVLVEGYGSFFEYVRPDGSTQLSSREIADRDLEGSGFKERRNYQFRDYDRSTLAELIDGGLDGSPRGAMGNLLERLVLVKPILEAQPADRNKRKQKEALRRWTNRSQYDRERWYPDRFGPGAGKKK